MTGHLPKRPARSTSSLNRHRPILRRLTTVVVMPFTMCLGGYGRCFRQVLVSLLCGGVLRGVVLQSLEVWQSLSNPKFSPVPSLSECFCKSLANPHGSEWKRQRISRKAGQRKPKSKDHAPAKRSLRRPPTVGRSSCSDLGVEVADLPTLCLLCD